MKQNVLVFPCGSEIGLEIFRSLQYSTHFNLIGGSSIDDHGKFVYKNYVGNIPSVDEPGYIDSINAVVEAHKIDFIFPAHDSVVLKLAQASANGELKCKAITSQVAICEVARSKLKTYEAFKTIITTPMLYMDVASLTSSDFPIFLKPDIGQGSKGTYLAKTREDVEFYIKKDPSLLMLEYLPGKEYTIDCFTNKEGKLLFYEGRERRRIQNGISVNSVKVNDDRFSLIANKINDTLKFRGLWFFQVKENIVKELVLMEIAPRAAGTMGLVRCEGVNLVLLSLFDAMGYEVSIFENNYDITIDRALENKYRHNINYDHVYLDFDDLVVFEGKVNPAIMAFIYQSLNKNIQLHLLTKHKDSLKETLKKFRLTNVFDELIVLKDSDEKYTYISEEKAIFIDDSFLERKKVFERCHIPVFDGHMLEGLMEKF